MLQLAAEVAVRFEFPPGAVVTFCDPLKVSLDCSVCRRCHRTIVFREGHAEGICTPATPSPARSRANTSGVMLRLHTLCTSGSTSMSHSLMPSTRTASD